jgi:dihydroflavonol-4-reductase
MARSFMYFDSGKARRELGLPQRPVKEALQSAVDWFKNNNYA